MGRTQSSGLPSYPCRSPRKSPAITMQLCKAVAKRGIWSSWDCGMNAGKFVHGSMSFSGCRVPLTKLATCSPELDSPLLQANFVGVPASGIGVCTPAGSLSHSWAAGDHGPPAVQHLHRPGLRAEAGISGRAPHATAAERTH